MKLTNFLICALVLSAMLATCLAAPTTLAEDVAHVAENLTLPFKPKSITVREASGAILCNGTTNTTGFLLSMTVKVPLDCVPKLKTLENPAHIWVGDNNIAQDSTSHSIFALKYTVAGPLDSATEYLNCQIKFNFMPFLPFLICIILFIAVTLTAGLWCLLIIPFFVVMACSLIYFYFIYL